MWNEWNRWWSGRGAAGEPPPEGLVLPASQSENNPAAASEPNAVEPRIDPNLCPGAIDTKSENADASIAETVPPVERTQEPPGLPDRGDETAPEFGDAPQPPAWNDLGANADEPAEVPTSEFGSPPAHFDPVAELKRQGLGLPTGKNRTQRGRRLVRPEELKPAAYNPQQRLMILDCWQRSGLPAKDFATLVGVSKHTLYAWKQRFTQQGPAGLLEQPRGAREGSRLPDLTKRTILLLKQAHPDWGCERISQMLLRGPALPASPPAVSRVLHEAGYQLDETPTRPHPDKVRFFERARPNQLWQTDLFTFVLKRQNRRVYLVAFLDDHSRFLVSFGLHASQSTALVLEVLRAGIAAYGAPEEVKDRVAANALELARNGLPKPPFYMTGQLGGKNFSLHAEGERVFLTREGGLRQEVDLVPPAALADSAAMPKAICPDGSPAAGLLGDAPAQTHDALPPEESPPTTSEGTASQEGGKP